MKVGLIGCGTISPQYLKNLPAYPGVEVAACSDIDLDKARSRAREFGVPIACTVEELLANPDISLVVNLTIPATHADVSLAAIAAGKQVYSEKPLAVEREDGDAILREARRAGVMVGCAPDTFLGAGIQTCRKLIDDGLIGRPSPRWPRCSATGTNTGTRPRPSTTRSAAVRCSTWALTTSPPW